MPLAGLGGRGPVPTLISGKEAGGAPITFHAPTSTHFPAQGPCGSRTHNIAGLMYNIYKRGATASSLLPQTGPWGLRLPGAETLQAPASFFSQKWNVSYGPGLGWGESQPPQDW